MKERPSVGAARRLNEEPEPGERAGGGKLACRTDNVQVDCLVPAASELGKLIRDFIAGVASVRPGVMYSNASAIVEGSQHMHGRTASTGEGVLVRPTASTFKD